MKRERVSQIISQIDEKYINEATMFSLNHEQETASGRLGNESGRKPAGRFRWSTLAACLAAAMLAGFAAFAVTAEAKMR